MSSVPTTDPIIDKAVSMARRGFTPSGIYEALRPHISRDDIAAAVVAAREEAARERNEAARRAAIKERERQVAEAQQRAEAYRSVAATTLISEIVDAVAVETCVNRELILGKCRNRSVSRARQSIMYLAAVMTDKSLPFIARALKRDHTTVLYGIQAHCIRNGIEFPRDMRPCSKATRLSGNMQRDSL